MRKGRFVSYIKNPLLVLVKALVLYPRLIQSDKQFLKLQYYLNFEKWPDLINPQCYNEKLQWLKLYDRKPIYTQMVDKYEAKKYVSDIIGNQYIIPTLGIFNSINDIDFESLPDQFVLKCTHDSGGVVICKDKSKFNQDKAKQTLNAYLHRRYYWRNREWPYKNVKPRIIAEQYMEDAQFHELRDYKFFCFDGEVKALFIASDRQKKGEETKFDFFDADYNHLDLRNGHPNSEVLPAKPQSFELMKQLAAKLSKGIPHVRVDFYEVNGKVYFGELTFFHWSGFVKFDPEKWDEVFGSWIKLPRNIR